MEKPVKKMSKRDRQELLNRERYIVMLFIYLFIALCISLLTLYLFYVGTYLVTKQICICIYVGR